MAFTFEPISPSEAGFNDALEADLDKAIAGKSVWNLHGLVILRHGHLVLERYFEGEDNARGRPLGHVAFTPGTLHDLRSVSKSIVGLLYGIALGEGKVPAPEQPLSAAFPEYSDLFADAGRAAWTVRHVLTMTMGTDWDELGVPYTDPTNSEIAMDRSADSYRYVLGLPVVTAPGKHWIYNGGATTLLGRMIVKGTGVSLHDYARRMLFDPLGIVGAEWLADDKGDHFAASGLRMTPRDLARIGMLMLSGGALDGRQIVPASWVERSMTPYVDVDDIRSYGYHWYMGRWSYVVANAPRWDRNRIARFRSAIGNGGQRLFLFPDLDLAVAVTAGNYDAPDQWVPPTRLVRDVILPNLL